MTKEEQKKYFKEKYGIDIDEIPSEKDNERYTGLTYDYPEDEFETETEPFSPKPHKAIRISGDKPQDQYGDD